MLSKVTDDDLVNAVDVLEKAGFQRRDLGVEVVVAAVVLEMMVEHKVVVEQLSLDIV